MTSGKDLRDTALTVVMLLPICRLYYIVIGVYIMVHGGEEMQENTIEKNLTQGNVAMQLIRLRFRSCSPT